MQGLVHGVRGGYPKLHYLELCPCGPRFQTLQLHSVTIRGVNCKIRRLKTRLCDSGHNGISELHLITQKCEKLI